MIFSKKRKKKSEAVSNTPKTSFIRGYKQFWPFLKPYWFLAVLGIILTIPVGALDAVVASFLKPFMDSVLIEQEKDFSANVPFFILGFSVVQGFFLYTSGYVNSYVGGRIALELKRTLYKHLLAMQMSFYDQNTSGGIYFGFSNDPDLATVGLVDNIKLVLTKFFSCVSLVCVLIYNSWQLSIYAVGILLILFWPMSVVRNRIRGIMDEYVKMGTTVVTRYNETAEGNRVIKLFNLQDHVTAKFDWMVNFMFRMSFKMVKDTGWLAPVMHLVTAIGVAGVLLLGMHLILIKEITPGTFVAFISALLMLYAPIKNIGNNFIAVQQSLLALDRIYQKLETKSFETEDQSAKVKLENVTQSIKFEHVTFGYDPKKPVIKDISFEVKVGTKVALVGNSGGGKSTVCALIPRFYDVNKGRILIDGIDIRDYDIGSLRNCIGAVFQDNFLFDSTIRENITCGDPDITDEQVASAVRSACLEDVVAQEEKGLDTLIGSRGLRLSGGQRQRLAIARAIVKNAPVVILDEATSALDNKSEKVVQEALDKLMENRTTIVIAHRLSTVMDADCILVINDGCIVEKGTHAELLAKDGSYAALYKTQFVAKKKETTADNEKQKA